MLTLNFLNVYVLHVFLTSSISLRLILNSSATKLWVTCNKIDRGLELFTAVVTIIKSY